MARIRREKPDHAANPHQLELSFKFNGIAHEQH
jgi:hypothetical protein